MKSVTTRKSPPVTPAEWEALIAAAPGKDRPLTAAEKEKKANAVFVSGGGIAAVRAAVAQKRKRGERGPKVAPTKQLVSVRYSPEVLHYFKATGIGWQTRMNTALKEWLSEHRRAPRRRRASHAGG